MSTNITGFWYHAHMYNLFGFWNPACLNHCFKPLRALSRKATYRSGITNLEGGICSYIYVYIYMYNLGIVGWWGCRRIPGEKLLICETSEAPFWISPAFLTDATSPPHYDKPDRSWQLIQLIQSFKEHLFSEKNRNKAAFWLFCAFFLALSPNRINWSTIILHQ